MARDFSSRGRPRFVAGSVGPTTKLVSLGHIPIDEQLRGFTEQIRGGGPAAMQLGGTINAFIDSVFNFPTLSDAYKYAAYDGLGNLARKRAAMAVQETI